MCHTDSLCSRASQRKFGVVKALKDISHHGDFRGAVSARLCFFRNFIYKRDLPCVLTALSDTPIYEGELTMKRIAALALVLTCAACAPAGGNGSGTKNPVDGIVGQENRTALSMFYGDYTTVSQNGEEISATDGDLTCGTDAQIANAVATYPVSGAQDGSTYTMGQYTDPKTGEVVKSDDVWVAPGALEFDGQAACTDYHMNVFEDRGHWRMGKDFIEYTFSGTLLRDGQEITFDDYLRINQIENGQVQVQMNSKTTDGEINASWVLKPRQ